MDGDTEDNPLMQRAKKKFKEIMDNHEFDNMFPEGNIPFNENKFMIGFLYGSKDATDSWKKDLEELDVIIKKY